MAILFSKPQLSVPNFSKNKILYNHINMKTISTFQCDISTTLVETFSEVTNLQNKNLLLKQNDVKYQKYIGAGAQLAGWMWGGLPLPCSILKIEKCNISSSLADKYHISRITFIRNK